MTYPRLRLWDSKGEARWWPDFLFVPLAIGATGWFVTFHQNWLLGILAGALVMSLDELLWYLLIWRRRRAPGV